MPVANKVRHRAASPGGARRAGRATRPGRRARPPPRGGSARSPASGPTARSPPGLRPRPDRARVARPSEQGRTPAPVGQDARPRGGGSPRWGSASPGRPPPRPGRARPARRCTPARRVASRRSASAATASGRARGSRGARSESRPARRTPGSGSRTSSRSGPPAAFRPSAPAAAAAARRTPGSRSASSSCTRSPASAEPRAAATSTAAARTPGSGEPSLPGGAAARPAGRDGLPRWRIAAASTGPSSSARRAREQPPRLRALVAAGPERQGREAIGRRVRAVGDDLGQQVGRSLGGMVAQRLDDRGHLVRAPAGLAGGDRRVASRVGDLLPDHPPEHGQPDGVVGVVQCAIERPGDRLGPSPGHRVRRRGAGRYPQ